MAGFAAHGICSITHEVVRFNGFTTHSFTATDVQGHEHEVVLYTEVPLEIKHLPERLSSDYQRGMRAEEPAGEVA